MKTVTFLIHRSFSVGGLFAILLVAGLTSSIAQNTWIEKAEFGGATRYVAVGFSIGSKGYIGTGWAGSVFYYNDFWEYNPALDSWTQKADFGGPVRHDAVGFSIGSKGYIGTGSYDFYNYYNDFWEYDPATNTWTQKANFGGTARVGAVGFSIGGKGYIGTGYDGISPYYRQNDFWEYDPVTDVWTQKSNFGGTGRVNAVGFSIGSKGYIGIGYDNTFTDKNDFWEYDPTTDAWIQKANFGGTARHAETGFSIGTKGYIGTGFDISGNYKNDFWEYDPIANTWKQKANFGGTARVYAVGFSIDNNGYIGTGVDPTGFKKDFWKYAPDEGAPTCITPTSLTTGHITPTKTQLHWDAIMGVLGYKVRYRLAASSEWMNLQSIDNDKTLNGLATNTEYVWQVKSICSVNPIVSSGWSEKQFFTTDALRIEDANTATFEVYPNPFSQSATVSFYLNEESPVVIEIMDLNGRLLKKIADDNFSSGNYEVTLNCESLNQGIYFLKMKTNEGVKMKKIILLQ